MDPSNKARAESSWAVELQPGYTRPLGRLPLLVPTHTVQINELRHSTRSSCRPAKRRRKRTIDGLWIWLHDCGYCEFHGQRQPVGGACGQIFITGQLHGLHSYGTPLGGDFAASVGYLKRAPTLAEIRSGEVEHLHQQVDVRLPDTSPLVRNLTPDVALVWWLMSRADHRGSDVRLSSGEIMRPSRIPRMGIESGWWHWKAKLTMPWKDLSAHINEKEARAAFVELRRRTRCRRNHGSRYLHLIDSMVAMSVLARKRSSSHQLNRVVRRMAAIELATSTCPVYAFVRSAKNPADRPSRKLGIKTKFGLYAKTT